MKAERKAHLDIANGVPQDVKGYGIKRPDTVPETQWSQAAADKLAATLQKHSGSPALAQELIGIQAQLVQDSMQQQQQAEQKFFAEQDTAFKTSVQQLNLAPDRANELVVRGAEILGINPKSPLLVTAEGRLACLKAQQLTAESTFKGDKGGDGGVVMDELAQARDIMSNPENPLNTAYYNEQHPMWRTAHETVDRLYAQHSQKGGRR